LVVRANGRVLMRLFINVSHSLQVLYTVKVRRSLKWVLSLYIYVYVYVYAWSAWIKSHKYGVMLQALSLILGRFQGEIIFFHRVRKRDFFREPLDLYSAP
jgi:hypothetical protein